MSRLTVQELKALVYSVKVLDNEAIRLRDADENKAEKVQEIKKQRDEIYRLLDRVKAKLAKDGANLTAKGYYNQKHTKEGKEKTNRVFVYNAKGIEDVDIYDLRKLKSEGSLKKSLGDVGLMEYDSALQLGIDVAVAKEILKGYVGLNYREHKPYSKNRKQRPSGKSRKADKGKTVENETKHGAREIKLVDIDRVRVVLPVHLDNPYNEDKKEKTKKLLEAKVKANRGIYPRDKALKVWRRKDKEDKRYTVYHIQDGYIRYVAAKEMGLKKIQVAIIDEE